MVEHTAENRGVAGSIPALATFRMEARDPLEIWDGEPEPFELVDYDPAWPGQFEEWHRRLAAALGASAVRIEHIGSTAVADLEAKPTLDVQLSVVALDDESAYVDQVASAGLRLRSRDAGHRYFRPPAGQVRAAHVHVCEAGSTWEREHLLFRDYLRSHPQACREYTAVKREAAARWREDRIAYTDAKTDVILRLLASAEAWVGETGWELPAPRAKNDVRAGATVPRTSLGSES